MARSAVSLASMSVTWVFMINLCQAIFRCGCRAMWAGAADHCNIHTPGARHCPWCGHGLMAFDAVLALVLIPQLLVSWWPGPWNWRSRLALALVLFPVLGSLIGVVAGWWDGYWV